LSILSLAYAPADKTIPLFIIPVGPLIEIDFRFGQR
jgi:hypothetical protein